MNYPPPPPPPGEGGFPPPGRPNQQPGLPPYAQTWAAPGQVPAGPPQKGPRTGLTLALLGGGLVLVLVVIGVVALVVRGNDSDGADGSAGGDARKESCEAYTDSVWNVEVRSAAEADPDKLQEVYDAALADITDDEFAALVEDEATITVAYYQAIGDWRQDLEDALSRGEIPEDTNLPAEITAQQEELQKAQKATLEACADVFPDRGDEPLPSITAPTLDRPTWMDDE